MKTIKIVAAVILVIAGVVALAVTKEPDTAFTKIIVTGTEGQKITGQYTADGIEQTIDEILPAEITIEARRLSLSVESSDESKDIFAQVFVNDNRRVSGGNQCIQVEVIGKTMFSSPRSHLIASNKPLP